MIADVVQFLRDRLNQSVPRDSSGGVAEDLFVYPGPGKDDSVGFKSDAVSIMLVRIEEDTVLRKPDRYTHVSSDGSRQRAEPEIRMSLCILIVANYHDDYSQSLHHLSRVVRYFQNHRVLNQENSPDLKPEISQLILELITSSFSEQNEIWGTLRSAYHPSALYKVKLIVFQDEDSHPLTTVQELIQNVVQATSS